MKLPSPHLKKGLLKGWKDPLRIVLEFFKNCQIYKFKTKSLKMLWERVQFSKVWSLQPATLVLAYSFIKHKLLYRWCSSFYVLFRNKHLQNITWWLLPLWNVVQLYLRNITWWLLPLWNVVELYFLCFSETRILRNIIWWLFSLYVNWQILMLRKPLNNRSSRPEVFCKKKCS